jgi:hypothetical protein
MPALDQLSEIMHDSLIRRADRAGDLSNRRPVVVLRHLGEVLELTLPTGRPIDHSPTSRVGPSIEQAFDFVNPVSEAARLSQPGRRRRRCCCRRPLTG